MSIDPVAIGGLQVQASGFGHPVLLAHGLSATRRYVVMGSTALERSGHRVISYDARGHGDSEPAPDPGAYEYADLAADMVGVLDHCDVERAVIAGASMGAHTAVRVALDHPERVAGLVLVTPAFDPQAPPDPEALAWWDGLADGLRRGGVDGFMKAYGKPDVDPRWAGAVEFAIRQRLALHAHPGAVADALEVVPRSRSFEPWEELDRLAVPALVVASRDEVDPGHPFAVGERWADALGCELAVEDEDESPIAWRGASLSKVIADVSGRAF